MRIIFLPETLDYYFNELTTILYEKKYFGLEESALSYVDSLIDDIKSSLHTKVKKKAPPFLTNTGRESGTLHSERAKTPNGLYSLPFTKVAGHVEQSAEVIVGEDATVSRY